MHARLRLPALILPTLALLAGGGCTPEGDQRPDRLAAIARWQDTRLAPADSLARMLESPDAHVRRSAARAAGLIGRTDVTARLAALLDDRSLAVRREACFALGVLADTTAVPALEAAAADPRPAMRLAALRGLAQVPNAGRALLAASSADDAAEAAAAWDGLRNQADRVPRDELLAALQAGLASRHADVLWRALRCAERLPDSTLVPVIASHLRSRHDQVRVHACRALAAQDNVAGLPAVLDAVAEHEPRGRGAARIHVAACRAVGRLAGSAADDHRLDAACAYLIEQAGSPSAHVAQAALEAMAAVVAERPLPAEAAGQESLLPVWRIRLARAAAAQLARPEAGPRAAAAAAWAAVRGAGAEDELVGRLTGEAEPYVQAALVTGAVGAAADPVAVYRRSAPRAEHHTLTAAALVDALAGRAADAPAAFLDSVLTAAAVGGDPVVAATAGARLDLVPGGHALAAIDHLLAAPPGPWRSDLVLAALGALGRPPEPTVAWSDAPDTLRAAVAGAVATCFDDPDVRIRLEARATALATGLVRPDLVPSEASLRATLPAVVRDPEQPPVAVTFAAPKVQGRTARGAFTITLDAGLAPNTCAAFLDLVRKGYFNGTVFHRVVPDFVVQGGDPTGTGWGGPGYTIRSEWSPAPYVRGAVGIAHSGKDTGGSQWFVTLSEQPHLVGRYTVFGRISEGMEVFDAMQPGDAMDLDVVP